jgi:hypothetical protein
MSDDLYTIIKNDEIVITNKKPASGVAHGHGGNTCPNHSWIELTYDPVLEKKICSECGLALGESKLEEEEIERLVKLNEVYATQIAQKKLELEKKKAKLLKEVEKKKELERLRKAKREADAPQLPELPKETEIPAIDPATIAPVKPKKSDKKSKNAKPNIADIIDKK